MKLQRGNKGETIVETLVAILIVAVCFIMLETSIITATKLNISAENENAPFVKKDASVVSSCTITIDRGSATSNEGAELYKCYKTSTGYYYYEK